MMADLIHINRESQQTEPALAKSWTVSADGLRYVLELRRGLRFSDGHAFDASDVVFTFQAMMDDKVNSPQRDLLILEGKPIVVRQIDAYHVAFDLPQPYAAAERLFDGFSILPRHRLEQAWRAGKLAEAWSLRTPPPKSPVWARSGSKSTWPGSVSSWSATPITGRRTRRATGCRTWRRWTSRSPGPKTCR